MTFSSITGGMQAGIMTTTNPAFQSGSLFTIPRLSDDKQYMIVFFGVGGSFSRNLLCTTKKSVARLIESACYHVDEDQASWTTLRKIRLYFAWNLKQTTFLKNKSLSSSFESSAWAEPRTHAKKNPKTKQIMWRGVNLPRWVMKLNDSSWARQECWEKGRKRGRAEGGFCPARKLKPSQANWVQVLLVGKSRPINLAYYSVPVSLTEGHLGI